MSIWETTTLERIVVPSSMTAAAVSSQLLSILKMTIGNSLSLLTFYVKCVILLGWSVIRNLWQFSWGFWYLLCIIIIYNNGND